MFGKKKVVEKPAIKKKPKVEKNINLIVTFDPHHLESAKREILHLLEQVKEKAEILAMDEGMAHLAVKDARKVVDDLRETAKKSADKFAHTMKWIPIDVWCKNTVKDMQKHIKKLVGGIGPQEKWKLELKTRKLKERPDELKLILSLTEVIDRDKVDLDNPEKIVRVEIMGNKAGLALLDKRHLLNVMQLKEAKEAIAKKEKEEIAKKKGKR